MLSAYLSEIHLPSAAIVLDVGCGTGAVTRVLAEMRGVSEVVGVDPSPIFVEKARELGKGHPQLSFRTGDGRALPSRMRPLTSSYSTRLCAICQIRRRPFMKRGESFALADG